MRRLFLFFGTLVVDASSVVKSVAGLVDVSVPVASEVVGSVTSSEISERPNMEGLSLFNVGCSACPLSAGLQL